VEPERNPLKISLHIFTTFYTEQLCVTLICTIDDLTIACEIVQISAGGVHGPFSDQPFTIKILYFLSKWQILGLRLVSGLE
jgi:hypothetical protein